MEVIPLQSGSSGNCVYVESGDVRLLFDAGISGRQAELRLKEFGKDIRQVDALVISHDHGDHTKCLGVFNRKYDLPVFISRPTLRTVQRNRKQGNLSGIRYFESGDSFRIGSVTIESVKTPHDAVDGVAFVVDDGEKRFGLLTDLGNAFSGLREVIATLDAVMLESNYDSEMLIRSGYPDMLKSRIAGDGGHLSYLDAAELLQGAAADLQWVVLAHLSEECNDPAVAIQTHRRLLGSEMVIRCADRYEASPPMLIRASANPKAQPARLKQQTLFG